MIVDTNTAKMIYDSLADDLSKRVFTKKLAYSMIDSTENLRGLARFLIPEFIDKVMGFVEQGHKVCVYGVGDHLFHPGKIVLALFNDYLAENAVFDKRAEQLGETKYVLRFKDMTREVAHIKINRPEQIPNLGSNIVMIVPVYNQEFQKEIITELLYMGIPLNKIIFFPHLYNNYPNTYFYHPFWKWGLEEVFVDCGCFDGNTSRQFLNLAERLENMSVAKIIAYEPDETSFNVCKQNMTDVPSFIIKNACLWNKCETLRFSATGNDGSRIAPTGNVVINTATLDEDLLDQKVTFIKIDIEGAELNALKGAEKTIRNQRPKLAISVYHMAEDILAVPEFIVNLNLNYNLYLRHQTAVFFETILYAVPL